MVNENKKKIAKKALHEHRELQRLFQSVGRLVATELKQTGDGCRALARDLENMREHLGRHFSLEEESGLFEDILERLPMSDAVVQALKREHSSFLKELRGLIHHLEHSHAEDLESIRKNTRSFIKKVQDHEELENDLLQRAYYLDLGAVD